MSKLDPREYRPCVGAMLLNREGRVFVGLRIDNRLADRWQMPQGGIDAGEDPATAVLRELAEETGIGAHYLEVAEKLDGELYYDLPQELAGTLWGGKYLGQRQTWFLVRFSGTDADVNLEAHDPPEFCEWKWVAPDELPNLIVPFKKAIYTAVVDGFRDRI